MNEKKKIVVHAGDFHADDAMCVALAELAFPGIEYERLNEVTPEMMQDESVIVADIGSGQFDHHQMDTRVREDGNKYAACGLLFEEIWDRIYPDKNSAEMFENDFIIPIEHADTGVAGNPLSRAIFEMNPLWGSSENADENFRKAVGVLREIVKRDISNAVSRNKAAEIIEESDLSYMKDQILVMDRAIPWKAAASTSDALFAIYPDKRNDGYVLEAVPVPLQINIKKQLLPEGWLTEPPAGCTFIHPDRFLAVFTSEEAALEAAQILIAGNKE